MKRTALAYKGDLVCEKAFKDGRPCTNQAYFHQDDKYCCGVHRQKATAYLKLDPDPNRARKVELLRARNRDLAAAAAERNQKLGITAVGHLILFKLRMMKMPPLVDGWLNVFPNYRAGSRKDGYGCPALSPMRLGPVLHRQPGLPPSLNIENYHQFNKVYPMETTGGIIIMGSSLDALLPPSAAWEVRREAGYRDPEPHRHKFSPAIMKQQRRALVGAQNRNAPLYSVHLDLAGNARRFTYVESRYFYCCAYEKLAKVTEAYRKLSKQLKDGYQLIICGYDARDIRLEDDPDLYVQYCNPTEPFGHELVLYSLLMVSDPHMYPWHRYRRDHPRRYDQIAHMQ